MAITVVFVARVPQRKKIIKQYKSKETADKAVQAMNKKFKHTFYVAKKKARK